jgi:hypothetical protein
MTYKASLLEEQLEPPSSKESVTHSSPLPLIEFHMLFPPPFPYQLV